MSADMNGDGNIDFEEFMKHFSDVLNMIEFNTQMSIGYNQFMIDGFGEGTLTDLKDIGKKAKNEVEFL